MEYKTRKQLAEELANLKYTSGDLGDDVDCTVVKCSLTDNVILVIYESYLGSVDNSYDGFIHGLTEEQRLELMKIVIPYVLTPLNKRKDTKLYKAYHKLLSERGFNALNLELSNGIYFLDTPNCESSKFQTEFTQEELEGIGVWKDKCWRILEANL